MATSLPKFLIWIIANVVCIATFTNNDYNITHFDEKFVKVSYYCSVNEALEIFYSD